MDKLQSNLSPAIEETPPAQVSFSPVPVRTIATASLETVTVHDFEGLISHRDAWDRLAWEAPQRNASLLPAWVDASLRHGRAGRVIGNRWLCLFAYSGNRLVGALQAIVSPHRFLGESRPIIAANDQLTISGDVLLAPDQASAALHALLAELRKAVPNHVGIDFSNVRSNAPLLAALKQGVGGYVVCAGRRRTASYLDLKGDFENYLAGLGSMRRNLKRFRKKLESWGPVSIEIVKGDAATEDLLPEFLALEASGWKGRAGSAILSNPNHAAFYATLVRNFASEGRLEWHVIRVAGRAVATQLAFVSGGSLVLEKCAFDEDLAECRLGTLLAEVTLREAFSRPELDRLDTNSVSDMYPTLWRMPQDEYADVHLVRCRPIPMIAHWPIVGLRSIFETQIRPRIPPKAMKALHDYRRRGDRKPRRAADSRSLRPPSPPDQDTPRSPD